MKVAWFHRFGGPEVLVCEETGEPTPGTNEALVRVRAASINHVDLDHRAGTSRIPVTFPHILGREFAGEVAALGGDAGPLKEGDRVWVTCRLPCGTCEFCLSGRDNLCVREGYFGLDLPGGYAEYVKVPIANLNPLPSHVSSRPLPRARSLSVPPGTCSSTGADCRPARASSSRRRVPASAALRSR